MNLLVFFGYSLIHIVILLLTGAITGCGIAAGFDLWKRIKSWRKNKSYIKNFEEEAFAAAGA